MRSFLLAVGTCVSVAVATDGVPDEGKCKGLYCIEYQLSIMALKRALNICQTFLVLADHFS